ncbi:MAG: acyltransferase domain-containing protein [Alphaproteobacteria bacterium]|nr:acyltransferase domain-containing protein [Alphaproteobacteria bacterium]
MRAAGSRPPVVWMFPGHGAQYFHMGRALYDGNETFRYWMDRLAGVAADYVGQSIVDVVYDEQQSKGQPFENMLCSHPALFIVQFAMAQTLLAKGFPPPDHLLGASLGEFVAAAVAGVSSVEDMLFDVIKQARLFELHCSGGAMLAVIDDVATFDSDPLYADGCELAGVSFDRCFVVSGLRSRILQVAAELKQRDVVHQLLPGSVAFHSSLVDGVEELFVGMFASRVRRPPTIPILSCAGPMGGVARFSSAYWWRVVRQPIHFSQALSAFAGDNGDAIYLDLGPSGNMAAYVKYNMPASLHGRIMPLMSPYGRDVDYVGTALSRLSLLLAQDEAAGARS